MEGPHKTFTGSLALFSPENLKDIRDEGILANNKATFNEELRRASSGSARSDLKLGTSSAELLF